MKRALLPLVTLAVLVTGGCGSTVQGEPSPSGGGLADGPPPSMEPQPSAATPSRTTARPTLTAKSKAEANPFAGLKACELVKPEQQPFPFGTPEERKDLDGNSEGCLYSGTKRPNVSILFLPVTTPTQLVQQNGTRGKQAPVTVGRHSGFQFDDGSRCHVALGIGEKGAVRIFLHGERESVDELCGLARKVADVVEAKLPAA